MTSRADFLKYAAAAAAARALMPPRALGADVRMPRARELDGASGSVADLIVVNARVHTMDERVPRADAFAVSNGRFIAVGSRSDVETLLRDGTEVIDAAGMTVLPGFIDAHCHVNGIAELVNVDANVGSVAAIKLGMAARAAETPPGYWVIGSMYDDTKLAEGRPLTRRDLDEAVPDHPAVVTHRGGHTAVYNSRAFALAGVTAETRSPDGGHIQVRAGELTGLVAEQARSLFERIAQRTPLTREIREAAVIALSKRMAAAGITSVHQTGTDDSTLTAFQDAARSGELGFRIYAFPAPGLYRTLMAAGIRTGFGDDVLRIGGVKYTADGSASERTMRMSTPYVGRPADYGILVMSQEELNEAVEQAHRAGWQIGIHANGDVAIDMVLNAYERATREWPRPDARHRIEHCSLVNPQLLRRIAALGVIPTPFWTYVHFHGEKWSEYGPEKLEWMFAHRSFLDHGIPVAGASDYPPGAFEPLMAIQSMVTRTDYRGREWGPSQRITVPEALRIATMNGARASFEEHAKGSITAGKLADFVMLEADPHEVEPDRIKHIRVVRTVLGGRTTHVLEHTQ